MEKTYKIVGSIVVSVVAGCVIFRALGATVNGAAHVVDRIAYKRKIKKGLKDGSIIEIDGKYYEVEITGAKEA